MFECQLVVVVEELCDILSKKVVEVESKSSNLAVSQSQYYNAANKIVQLPSDLCGLNSPRYLPETTRICMQQTQKT